MEASAETPSQRQARIRREKREKKILEGGSARLEKITGLSGRPPPEPIAPSSSPPQQQEQQQQSQEDPEEVDISNHPYTPARSSTPLSSGGDGAQAQAQAQAFQAEQMRRLLRSGGPGQGQGRAGDGDGGPGGAEGGQQQDDMMRLLQQMMGVAPALGGEPDMMGGAGAGGGGGLPPGLAAMLGGGGGGASPSSSVPAATTRTIYIWKILHALASIALGVYILYSYPLFSGTQASRLLTLSPPSSASQIFYAFATTELALQSTRYILEQRGGGGQSGGEGGMLVTISQFLPQPWGGRLRLAGRYVGVWNTLVEDATLVIFLVGVAAWWKGGV